LNPMCLAGKSRTTITPSLTMWSCPPLPKISSPLCSTPTLVLFYSLFPLSCVFICSFVCRLLTESRPKISQIRLHEFFKNVPVSVAESNSSKSQAPQPVNWDRKAMSPVKVDQNGVRLLDLMTSPTKRSAKGPRTGTFDIDTLGNCTRKKKEEKTKVPCF